MGLSGRTELHCAVGRVEAQKKDWALKARNLQHSLLAYVLNLQGAMTLEAPLVKKNAPDCPLYTRFICLTINTT